MIELPRAAARAFRALLRRSVMVAAPRGPCPSVLASAGPDGLVLRAAQGEVGLTLRLANPGGHPDCFALPSAMLTRIEGSHDAPVVLEALAAGQGVARWQERGGPRSEA